MKAVRIHAYGDESVLSYEDAPRPAPGEGEVLVRIHAATVNPFDCAVRKGYMAAYVQSAFPIILGTDASGVVEEVGPGVTEFKAGDEVYARAGVARPGSYAEYVAVPVSDTAAKPRTVDHIHAAAIPHVSLTAWQALIELAKMERGQTLLVHGASGGVGHIAVQLAKVRGVRVIGTSSRHVDFVRELGVDDVIDYSAAPFEQSVHDVDVVLDTIGGDTQRRSWDVLKPGGMLVSTIEAPSAETAAAYGVRHAMVYSTPPIGEVLKAMATLIDEGHVRPHVSDVLRLAEVQRAHRMVEHGHTRGKLVLQVA